ncbi:MAG: GGDEF domain-containing protein [Lachnospiraceae bacterium]|nr:GGDEF domain-containing protein [Lachnospiraceae bacterium]MBQ8317409.1 GGDEF domain-containing protein [Lachnospiraceae bacterium]
MKKRFEIALIISDVTNTYSREIINGAIKAAEEADINLTIFPIKYIGNQIDHNADSRYEYQFNSLLNYAALGNFDYVIAALGCIIVNGGEQIARQIHNMFGDTPFITICMDVDNLTNVQYDNYNGIVEAVNHLVSQGRKHICMLTGNLHNQECKLRLNAYKEAMAINHMPFDNSMILECNMAGLCEDEITHILQLNPDMDALICVNDMVAQTVYKVFQRKGIIVGKQIAVVGYDDIPESAKMNPPLASANADPMLLGYNALMLSVADLTGQPLSNSTLKTTFIPRLSSMYNIGSVLNFDELVKNSSYSITESILQYIFYIQEHITDMQRVFWYNISEYLKTLNEESSSNFNYLRYIYNLLEDKLLFSDCTDESHLRIIDVFDSLVLWVNEYHPENLNTLNSLRKQVSQKLISSLMGELSGEGQRLLDNIHNTNLVTRQTLMVGDNATESYSAILSKMHCLNIKNSYLYLIDEPWLYKEFDFSVSELSWKIKSYQHGEEVISCHENHQPISSSELFSNKYMPENHRRTHIVVDLYSREYQYGILLCEIDDIDFMKNLEFLVYQLSASVKIIDLIKKQELMFEELHTKNLALEKISKIDELTGLNNRRGFYDEVGRLLSNGGKELVICYADMDGLKTINDTYGHMEGDYSLKQIALCLQNIFHENAVIGRMGGDEFVAIIPRENTNDVEEIRNKKNHWMNIFNKNSSKPYNIDISMGFYECKCSNHYDLKLAIDKADDVLYTIKVKKKNK